MPLLLDIPFRLDTQSLIRKMRIGSLDDHFHQRVATLVKQVREAARPKAYYEIFFVDQRLDGAVVIGGRHFTSKVLRRQLDSVERVFAYVATCGREVDEIPVPGDDMLLPFCLDLLKETLVRSVSTYLKEFLDVTYKPGRLSCMAPGSLPDWPVSQQRELFALLGDTEQSVGVTLLDSFLMVPVKSVSGICFPTETSFESCQLCPRDPCRSRRAAYDYALVQQYGLG